MSSTIQISTLEENDISFVTDLARKEGFSPGAGDLNIYRHTDDQGLWVARLEGIPVGCIAGVRYNLNYGFIGLFIVIKTQRGNGYGLKLWKKAFDHLKHLPCIGLEAAPDRLNDYSKWGFTYSSKTTRWQWIGSDKLLGNLEQGLDNLGLKFLEGASIPSKVVNEFDEKRETCPRPHFLSDWLNHPDGKVLAVLDNTGNCHGFGRIRPCLLRKGEGWRIGPLLADSPLIAEYLIRHLVHSHTGVILLDSPELNLNSNKLLLKLGFKKSSETYRMYRGKRPTSFINDVYALACLELG